jgi:hypothetical protein
LSFTLPDPELQASFASALTEIRQHYLQDALSEAVQSLAVPTIDAELAQLVPVHSLTMLAGQGLRGELMFPVPAVLAANPRLLGYYRLLYGYSRNEFYTSETGSAGSRQWRIAASSPPGWRLSSRRCANPFAMPVRCYSRP